VQGPIRRLGQRKFLNITRRLPYSKNAPPAPDIAHY